MARCQAMVKAGASIVMADLVDLLSPRPTAILFMGDRVAPHSPTVDRLSKPENVAALVSRKFGPDYNVWIVGPPRYSSDSMACYDGYIGSISAWGSPLSYDPRDLPAATTTLSVLTQAVREVRSFQRGMPGHEAALPRHPARTIVLGFSKGGVVLNQLMAELASLRNMGTAEYAAALPRTPEDLLKSVAEFHYLDVGLNDSGAYQTNGAVLEGLAMAAGAKQGGLTVFMHGTPRQWMDPRRPWIAAEKDRCIQLLREASSKLGQGKLKVHDRLYFLGRNPSLEMHFEILEVFEPCFTGLRNNL